jgi:uncharacterized protein YwqG
MFGSGGAKKLKPFIEKHRRIALTPVVSAGEGAPDGSRFNGAPFLAEGEAWPSCALCAKPMAMFLQLNLGKLPPPYESEFGDGLLQLFYCVRDEDHDHADLEDWAAFDHKTKLARVIPAGASGALAAPLDVGLNVAPLAIVDWRRSEEAPNPEEAAEHGLETVLDRSDARNPRTKFVCQALGIDTGWLSEKDQTQIYEHDMAPAFGDKLGGWPGWVQGVEYPSCPTCGRRMWLVFQIDSEDHVPFMFGDVGCGHITQCPQHKDVVTFAWACH